MQHGAVTLAREFLNRNGKPDLFLASDILDLSSFLALTREQTARIPSAIYFHENQLAYPWSHKERNVSSQKAFLAAIHLQSALAADAIFFNSDYNRRTFLDGLKEVLTSFSDDTDNESVEQIRKKSSILPLGMNLKALDSEAPEPNRRPLILWNHRWEYDKNPEAFFAMLRELKKRGMDFGLVVLGECPDVVPDIFSQAQVEFFEHIEHWGYVKSRDEYAQWLHRADILPVTSNQDFFGESIAEAIYCGCQPLLPKRLAYPELVPEDFQVFYESQSDLIEQLAQALQEPKPQWMTKLSQSMQRFDWSEQITVYDTALESL